MRIGAAVKPGAAVSSGVVVTADVAKVERGTVFWQGVAAGVHAESVLDQIGT